MKALNACEILEATAKGLGKWCLRLTFGGQNQDLLLAAPCLKELDHADDLFDFISEGGGTLSFDTEAEAREAYGSTVGEDGPTKTNPYSGPVKVHACLCGPDGKIRTENT
jgi:hypothetical protein